ncbi:hypothetical protein K5549_019282, partial [Capra hircus]
MWGTAAPALAGAGSWLHLFLAADSRSSLPSKDPSLILRKQELKATLCLCLHHLMSIS